MHLYIHLCCTCRARAYKHLSRCVIWNQQEYSGRKVKYGIWRIKALDHKLISYTALTTIANQQIITMNTFEKWRKRTGTLFLPLYFVFLTGQIVLVLHKWRIEGNNAAGHTNILSSCLPGELHHPPFCPSWVHPLGWQAWLHAPPLCGPTSPILDLWSAASLFPAMLLWQTPLSMAPGSPFLQEPQSVAE